MQVMKEAPINQVNIVMVQAAMMYKIQTKIILNNCLQISIMLT